MEGEWTVMENDWRVAMESLRGVGGCLLMVTDEEREGAGEALSRLHRLLEHYAIEAEEREDEKAASDHRVEMDRRRERLEMAEREKKVRRKS